MKNTALVLLALLGIASWYIFSLPRYQGIDLSVSQSRAIDIARDFLSSRAVDNKGYKTAAVFSVDDDTDRFLQRTLGTRASQQLVKDLDYPLFFWTVRFFKERQKEEFRIIISSRTGQVVRFFHDIESTAAREVVGKDTALRRGIDFLRSQFGFDPSNYVFRGESVRKFENRVDYIFTWEARDVNVPWDGSEGGRLLTKVAVSGNDVLTFDKAKLDIPEGFRRYVSALKQTGENLVLVFHLFYMALLTIAIMMVVNRKQHTAPRVVRPFYVGAGIAVFVLMLIEIANGYQYILSDYPTTQSFADFALREVVKSVTGTFFVVLAFVLPALAGEALRFETAPQRKNGGILSAALSSFYSRPVAAQITAGYGIAAILLGAQALIFHLGYRYCGVWDELTWLQQSSTTVVPAATALLLALYASLSEETTFRLFAINLFKSRGLAIGLAVFLSAVIWGFGHTGYEVYPMWFRGVEVTCLGVILGIAYLRFGLICALVAHFLMDAVLLVLPYLLKPKVSFDFVSSLIVIALPLFFAAAAFALNRPSTERPWRPRFNRQQEFNYGLLRELLGNKTPEQRAALAKDLVHNGWDPAVVESVLKNDQ